jgi:hypothetical protein
MQYVLTHIICIIAIIWPFLSIAKLYKKLVICKIENIWRFLLIASCKIEIIWPLFLIAKLPYIGYIGEF